MGYYIGKEPGGCFLAIEDGRPVGTISTHVWGSVGWFGPLEVDPRFQDRGIGKQLVNVSVNHLRSRGCSTIGCETMAGSARNIAFYHKLGFRSRGLSHVMFKQLGDIPPEKTIGQGVADFKEGSSTDRFKEQWNRILPGLDYSVEIDSAIRYRLGRIFVTDTGARSSHAIVHTHQMFEDSQNAILKLLVAEKEEQAQALLEACETAAAIEGKTGMFIRTYDVTPPDIAWLFRNGYHQQGVSVRLLLQGNDESGTLNHISCWSG